MYNIAVILAGGFGTRLFPLSRINYPKQFLRIFGGKSLLQITYERLKNLKIFDEIWVCANKKHLYLIRRDLQDICHRIVLEEKSKNTAYAFLYSAFKILNNLDLDDSNFIFFPSDHFILNDNGFDVSVRDLIVFLGKYQKTFVVGVKPTFPSTEYGYIKKGDNVDGSLFTVDRFIEKPNKSRARYYLKKSCYLWNSGIYAFNFGFFLNDLFFVNPDLETFSNLEVLEVKIDSFPNISIDYLYSQKSSNLAVLEGNFGWSDLGSFEEIIKVSNLNKEKVIQIDSNIDLVLDEFEDFHDKKYCFIDVDDLIIVDTNDFQLVSKKGKTQKISKVLENVSKEQRKYNSFDFRPWGYYREIEKSKNKYRIKNIVIYPFQELSLQYHNHRDEYWIVVNGRGKLIIDNTFMDILPGKFFHIPKGSIHKVINDSNENMEIIEVQFGDILSEDDIIRINDKYDRV
ncbi:MAG: sugar phosphate nucleotidyltransferase [bacterium]|nr:sugar phosphate nucleotidyltransferase [bacterium]